MILVGAVGGAVVGLVVGSQANSQALIALLAAFVAGILALVVGRAMFGDRARLSPSSSIVIWNLILAALIGALAGHELAVDIREPPISTLIGTTSGLIAAVLIASTVVTIAWARNRPDHV